MGVPAFFRWLTIRYPQVVIDALSEEDLQYYFTQYNDKNSISLDDMDDPSVMVQRKIEENNPKVDNLYLDMNGIIHPCCHPIDRPAPKTETEMFNLIFEYIDRVVNIVNPREKIYMAIDGVAPRAKQNQ